MSKIRMNTELRNKLFNKIKDVFENEDTQEKEAFLQSREWVNEKYVMASQLAKQVVERSYPVRINTITFGDPLSVHHVIVLILTVNND